MMQEKRKLQGDLVQNDAHSSQPIPDRLASRNLLPVDVLTGAMTSGQQALAACTLDRPPMARGVHVWGTIIETLRQLGRQHGWQRSEGKLATVLSPDGLVQITVATGDEATGLEAGTPRTKYPRGAASIEAIEDNQLTLFPGLVPIKRRATAKPGVLTWLLLHRRLKDSVRWEISLPKAADKDGMILSWEERIVFDQLQFDAIDDSLLSGVDLDEAAEQFDPIVTRKQEL
jgi:hypothetical protein